MQAVNQFYKEHMKEALRNRSYMRVAIGLINQEAQASAYIPDHEKYTYYSSFKKPLDNYEVQELYATCDQDYTVVDGSVYFLPRERSDVVLNQGIVSEALLGPIEIRFPVEYDIKGLTIEFGKAYPVDFTIESDNNTVEITGNAGGHFITEEIFAGATFLRFIPSVMVNGQSRFRIHQLTMGIGIYFDNQKILSATKKEYVSPVMEELPTIDFSLTVNNKDRAFDIENEASSVNFLEIGQDITVLYGQELDDGSVEWLPGATVQLKEWSADDEEMEFSATDRFDDMDGTYYKGLYRPEGISLYDLAVDVFSDAGIDERTYWIDSYLKSVKVTNPIPVVAHKEALQLIANAGRCILYQDREGNIFLKSSFIPDMTAGSENETYFSNAGAVLDKTEKKAYAMAAKDYTSVTPIQYFLPVQSTGTAYLNTGYISEAVAGSDGSFAVNPTVEIILEASFKCFGLTLEFGDNNPAQMVFHAYHDGKLVEDYTVTGLTATTVISHEFEEFDRLVLEFIKGFPNNRVVLNNVTFGDSTDYVFEYGNELTKTPKGTQLAKVRELQVIRTLYSQAGEKKELAKETITVTAVDNRYTFYFSNPSYDLSCAVTETVNITNLMSNGSFEDGLTGWNASNSALASIATGGYTGGKVCVIKSTGSTTNILSQRPSIISGHKYYLSGYFMRSEMPDEYPGNDEFDMNPGEKFNIPLNPYNAGNILPVDGEWHRLSAIDTLTDTSGGVRVYTFGNKSLCADGIMLINLTEAFGAGKEPDKEWCDKHIEYFDGTVQISRYDCEIVESSSYFATAEITGVTGAVEVSITGREYTTVQTKVSRQLNPTGSLEVWENPLVSDTVHAANLADWIGDYMKADREYDLQYRGEPRIDANDIAFLENKYVSNLLLRVYEHTLKFNGALSGTIKARRDMSNVAGAKD